MEKEAILKRRLELMKEEHERARQSPRQVTVVETLVEVTPKFQPSLDKAAVSFTAEAVGRDRVTPDAATSGLQEWPPDADAERSVISDGGPVRERVGRDVALVNREVESPGTELTVQLTDSEEQGTSDEFAALQAVGRAEHDNRSQSDAGGGQCVLEALGPQGDAVDAERQEQPAVAIPRRKQSDSVEQNASVWPASLTGIVPQEADVTHLPVPARQGAQSKPADGPLEIEHFVGSESLPDWQVEGTGVCSREAACTSGTGKRLLACKSAAGEIARCPVGESCRYGRGEFSPTQVERPAAIRRSFVVAWGYFGQVWLFGVQIKLQVKLPRGAVPVRARKSFLF